jgi:hypothetical protein
MILTFVSAFASPQATDSVSIVRGVSEGRTKLPSNEPESAKMNSRDSRTPCGPFKLTVALGESGAGS